MTERKVDLRSERSVARMSQLLAERRKIDLLEWRRAQSRGDFEMVTAQRNRLKGLNKRILDAALSGVHGGK